MLAWNAHSVNSVQSIGDARLAKSPWNRERTQELGNSLVELRSNQAASMSPRGKQVWSRSSRLGRAHSAARSFREPIVLSVVHLRDDG